MDVDKEFAELFPQDPSEIIVDKPRVNLEKELAKKYHFKSMKDTKEIYYYDTTNGIYRKNANWLIEEECVKYHPEVKTNNVNDIVNRIIWSNYTR